jgi:hypothetical protein
MPMAKLTKASGSDSSDAAVGAELLSADPTIDQAPDVEVLGDSAYATGDMLHQLDEKKWKPLLKPWPIKPVVEGAFTIDDYTYDPDTNTLTCPAGVTRPVGPARRVSFNAACRGCPATRAVHHLSNRPARASGRASPAATRTPPASHRLLAMGLTVENGT